MSIQKIIRADNQPFAIIPNSAIRNAAITTGAFRLLAYLMSHKDGYELTYEQIERQTTLGRWAINQAAENLSSLGYLEVYRPKGIDGRFGAKHWVIMDPDAENQSTVGNSTMESPHMEKSTDNKENYLSKKTTYKDISSNDELFQKFWKAYPRKVAKAAAKKAFDKALNSINAEKLLEAVTALANDPNLPETTFIKHPATWLNTEGWEDEPFPKRVRSWQETQDLLTEKNKKQRDIDIQAAQELLLESQKAREAATAPPQCEHGKSLVRCIKCSSRLS